MPEKYADLITKVSEIKPNSSFSIESPFIIYYLDEMYNKEYEHSEAFYFKVFLGKNHFLNICVSLDYTEKTMELLYRKTFDIYTKKLNILRNDYIFYEAYDNIYAENNITSTIVYNNSDVGINLTETPSPDNEKSIATFLQNDYNSKKNIILDYSYNKKNSKYIKKGLKKIKKKYHNKITNNKTSNSSASNKKLFIIIIIIGLAIIFSFSLLLYKKNISDN